MPFGSEPDLLRKRLPVIWMLAAAIILPSLIYLLISVGFGYRAERLAIEAATVERARNISDTVDARLVQLDALMRAFATVRSIDEGNWGEAKTRAADFASLDPDWRNVELFDLTNGQRVVDLRNASDAPTVAQLKAISANSIRPVFSSIERHGAGAVFYGYLAIRSDREKYYLLRVSFAPELVQRLLLREAPRDGVSAVVDRAGNFIARTKGFPKRVGTPATPYLRKAVARGRSGIYRGKTWEGFENYTGFETSSMSGWSSHVAVSSSLIDSPRQWWRLTAALAGGASLALGLLFSWVAVRTWRRERQMDERVRQAERLETVGKLTGGVAHDFNNMLAIVLGNLELASRRLKKGEENVFSYIENAIAGAERAADLTRRLLTFSRKHPVQPEAFDVNALIRGMDDLLVRTLGETVSIRLEVHPKPCTVYADKALLENAIVNLAVNARDAMPSGGTVDISTKLCSRKSSGGESGAFVELVVSDTGQGMTPEISKRAFEPFFTTKDVGKGTGLGLSQVHGFVTQSHGFLELDSRPGVGTRVCIFLPIHPGPVHLVDETPSPTRPVPPDRTILVVEDEEQVRAATMAALQDLGLIVAGAKDAEEALQILRSRPEIALMLTDIVMPGMGGIELAEKAADLRPDLKVLFATGYERDAATDELEDKILRKPFTIAELARRVGAQL